MKTIKNQISPENTNGIGQAMNEYFEIGKTGTQTYPDTCSVFPAVSFRAVLRIFGARANLRLGAPELFKAKLCSSILPKMLTKFIFPNFTKL